MTAISNVCGHWWDGANDSSIRVLEVTPNDAQYWDGPATAASYVKLMTAAAAGKRPVVGDQGKVSF